MTVSNLLTDEGASPYLRMGKADMLDALDQDYPFQLLTCGPMGVVGVLDTQPSKVNVLAERLFNSCPELCMDYELRFDADNGNNPLRRPDLRQDLVPLLAKDITDERCFWLPWGVDY